MTEKPDRARAMLAVATTLGVVGFLSTFMLGWSTLHWAGAEPDGEVHRTGTAQVEQCSLPLAPPWVYQCEAIVQWTDDESHDDRVQVHATRRLSGSIQVQAHKLWTPAIGGPESRDWVIPASQASGRGGMAVVGPALLTFLGPFLALFLFMEGTRRIWGLFDPRVIPAKQNHVPRGEARD